ncbi:MAG: hypothetical protein ABIS18_08825 [Actinomycetota bacterium]
MNDVSLRVPASPAFVHFLRNHAAGLAASCGFTIDAIDDIRLAIDEAAACLVDRAHETSTFTLEIASADNSLELWISIDHPSHSWPPAGFEFDLAWKVLTGLCDKVSYEIRNQRPGIYLLKTSGAPG